MAGVMQLQRRPSPTHTPHCTHKQRTCRHWPLVRYQPPRHSVQRVRKRLQVRQVRPTGSPGSSLQMVPGVHAADAARPSG